MSKAIALCSCPRLGFMDFMGHSLVAFGQNSIPMSHLYGVYWAQSLSEGIKGVVDEFDYIFVTDYDSIFTDKKVSELLRLIEANPEVDAVCSLQSGRFADHLFTVEGNKVSREAMQGELIPIKTGNFGLTVFRASAFKELQKPWFNQKPNSNGEWSVGSDKVDEDMYFWHNFVDSGKKAFLAPRVVIGHLELMIKWPDESLMGMFQPVNTFHEHGAPGNVWK